MLFSSILLGICQSTASRLLAKGLEKPVKNIFNPDKSYEKKLSRIIKETIEEYETKFPVSAEGKKFPFYHSKDIFEILSEHVLFETNKLPELTSTYEKYPNIIPATSEQLQAFYSLFLEKVGKDNELKQLFAESKYKEKIIEIDSAIRSIAADIKTVTGAVEEIAQNFRQDGMPVITPYFVRRKEEEELQSILDDRDILLLTGISFCGKSQLAKKIALGLVNKGYQYSYSDDIGEAIRFLRSTTSKRVFLLEDPFGHNSQSENDLNLRKVKELINNLPTGNKLIITSRIEVLKGMMSASSVDECSIGRHSWVDLTNRDPSFLSKVWKSLCEKNKIPEAVNAAINLYLSSANHSGAYIQVGQLAHLTNIPVEKLVGKNLESLLHLAGADSKDISIEIVNRGVVSYELFMALGLAASTTVSIGLEDLSFILSASTLEPGYISSEAQEFSSYSYQNRRNSIESEFPKYESSIQLSHEYLTELGFFQKRGFISITDNRISFTHPTYREAARYLLLSNNVLFFSSIDKIIRKVTVCLSSTSVLNCVKQFDFIYRSSTSEECKRIIRNHALAANRFSIFPGVRDNCFSFLLSILADLTGDAHEEILHSLQRRVSSRDVLWSNDIPYITPSGTVGLFDHLRDAATPNELEHTLNRINSSEYVQVSKVWDLILAIQNGSFKKFPNSLGLKYILNCDEVFVRQKIAHLIMIRSFPDDEEILDAIFSDDHPAVIFEGVKAAILKFASFIKSDQEKIRPYLVTAMSNPFVITRGNSFLSTFGIDYGSESIHWPSVSEKDKKIIWKLWSQLFQVFLKNYPRGLRFPNTGRFGSTLDESAKFISGKEGIEICKEYYNWIDRFLKFSVPDTYEFGLLPYLLDVTSKNTKGRFDLFKKIFSHSDTNFVTYSLSWALSYWKDLTGKEKNIILKILRSNRPDIRWLLATAITRSKVPVEIAEQVFKDGHYFEKEVAIFVQSLPPQLLEDSLSVFFGHPQPLGYLGLDHCPSTIWHKVMAWILSNEYHTGFDLCLREFVGNGLNGFASEIKNDLNLWSELCMKSSNKKRLAERLIFETARTTCNLDSAKEFWTSLIAGYKAAHNLSELSDLIVANILKLQAYNPEDLFEFFDSSFFEDELLVRMNFDKSLIDLLWMIKDDKISSEEACKKIESLLAANNPKDLKLEASFKYIGRVMNSSLSKFPCLKRLEIIENPIRIDVETRWKEFSDDYELNNWVNSHADS